MGRPDETASERLQLALEMLELGVEMMAARLRREHPGASPAEIDRMIDDWLGERPGAEHGDGAGTPVPLDGFR